MSALSTWRPDFALTLSDGRVVTAHVAPYSIGTNNLVVGVGHRHRAVRHRTVGWSGCVGRIGHRSMNCSGASHGGVVHVDACACGAERRTESNGRHETVGPWIAGVRS